MPYSEQDWIDRMKSRSDLSTQVTHLTKPGVIDGREFDGLNVLIKILREKNNRKQYGIRFHRGHNTGGVFYGGTSLFLV